MNSFKTFSVVVLTITALVNFSAANPLFEQDTEQEDGDERLFFSANGGISFTNSTLDLASLLTAGLLALLIALTLGGGLLNKGQQGGGYGYGQQEHHSGGYGSNSFHARSDKVLQDNDLASQMYQLAMAFKKYNVKETECQLFVSCEASQSFPAEQQSTLAEVISLVKPLMQGMAKHGRRAVQAKDEYVVQLLDAFKYGEELQNKNLNSAGVCDTFWEKCDSQFKKTGY